MVTCPECGAESPDGSVACTSCKHPFGRTLHAELAEGPPRLGRALDLASWISAAIAGMHDAKVVHQNLTPRHIYLVKRKGQDDLVKILNPNKPPAEGTARDYASPEELDGKASDPLSNIYSYGVILHEMVVGARPSPGSKIPPEVPSALADLVQHCLKKSPSQRPQSMKEIEERVTALGVAHRAGVLVKPPEPPEPSKPMRWVLPLILIPAVAVGGYFAYVKLNAPPPPPPPVVTPPPALPDASQLPDLGHLPDASQLPDLAVAAKPAATAPKGKHPKTGKPAATAPNKPEAPKPPDPNKPAQFDPFAPQAK